MTADAEPRAGSIVRRLERVVPSGPPRDVVGGAEHPMRDATRAAAFEPGWWTPDRAKEIETFFDELADDCHLAGFDTGVISSRRRLE